MERMSRFVSILCAAPLVVASGCMVPQSRYDRLATEYHAENQARRQLEDEVQRRDGEMSDVRRQLNEKDAENQSLAADAQMSKERAAQLQKALDEARSNQAELGEGVEILRTDIGFTYRIADQLLFDSGSTTIRDAGKKALASIAREILSKGYKNVFICGHTDSDPVVKNKDKYPLGNYELSLERALAVFGVLTKDEKVPESTFAIMGYGPSRPVQGASEKSKHRRVEIQVAVPKS
jgi:chemotaxis protein MotB